MSRTKKHNTKYSPEFKLSVIIDMREHGMSYMGAMRKYGITGHHTVKEWEQIYIEEGAAGFMVERRGRSPKCGSSRKKPLNQEAEKDLIAENQRLKKRNQYLEAENEYLKKLDALIRAEEELNGKKPK